MIDIKRVKKGDILIIEELLFGKVRLFYGPVVLIDQERNEVAIKLGEETRSFPVDKLWTIPAFVACKSEGGQRKPSPGHEMRVLAGFVAALLNGDINQSNGNDILEEIRKKGIPPAKIQEALEVLMSM